jgi:4-oxalocrotonate tautomerase
LADTITKDGASILNFGDASICVAFEEVDAEAWQEQVYEPDIVGKTATLYRKLGYGPADL